MKKRKIIIVAFLFLFLMNFSLLYSQSDIPIKKNTLNIKKHQHTINVMPFSFEYSYAQKISRNKSIGVSIQFGLGLEFLLNTPKYLKESNVFDTLGMGFYKSKMKLFSPILRGFKMQTFYEYYLFATTKLNFSLSYSNSVIMFYDLIMDHNLPNYSSFGISTAIFYGSNKIRFGHRIQFARVNRTYYDKTILR